MSLLRHVVEGEGPNLVLLNGGMMTFSSWEALASSLRKSYRVLRFDFRGQLLSPGPGPASLAGHAGDVLALLDHLGWESAHFVGTSFGAEVALELAHLQATRLLSLVAITAMDREDAEFRRQNDEMQGVIARILAGGERRSFWDLLLTGVYSADYLRREEEALRARGGQLDLLPRAYFEGIAEILRAIEGFDLTLRLRRYDFPSLVVLAADDRVMAAERSQELARRIGAEVRVHPGAGHALVAEEPQWLKEVCADFLARVGVPAGGR